MLRTLGYLALYFGLSILPVVLFAFKIEIYEEGFRIWIRGRR